MSSWIYLLLAILLEVGGTTCMKLSEQFTRWIPSAMMLMLYLASLTMLSMSLKRIDVGTAYAVWSGLGTAIIAAAGILFFNEPAGLAKFLSIGLIIAGVVGLNLFGSHP
ncbi:multidrug efflux SMR transporter [bacterium]|jgi:small multidrug resistance pump|nr:multidrug efflux SMR transporter [bacterium]